MKIQRIEWIDTLKGIGIIMVLLGHAVFPLIFKIIICSFHMPLFFFLSGITLKVDIDFKTYLEKRIRRLLIPLFFLSLIVIVIDKILYNVVLAGNISLNEALTLFPGIFIQLREGCYSSVLWYLACLFVSEMIIYFIFKFTFKVQIIVVFGSIIMTFFYLKYVGILLPWGLEISFIAVSFMYMGKMLSKYGDKLEKIMKPKYAIVCFIITVAISLYNSKEFLNGEVVAMAYSKYGNLLLFYINALFGILTLIILIRNNSYQFEKLRYIGRNSIIYYSLHYVVFIIPQYIAFQFLGRFINNFFGEFLIGIGYLVIALPMLYIISGIINNKMSFMLGRIKQKT